MERLRSAAEVRGFIEHVFVQLDDMVGDTVKRQAYDGLAEKKRSFQGPAYLDQIEKNAIYLAEGVRGTAAVITHYLCAGEPLLAPNAIQPYLFAASTGQAQQTTMFHVNYVRTGGCSGCEAHADHHYYSGWRELRQLGDWPRYIEEMEFSYIFYQAMFITAKILLSTLLQHHEAAGIARSVPANEVLDVVRERIDLRSNLWSGNMDAQIRESVGQLLASSNVGTEQPSAQTKAEVPAKPKARSVWERLGLGRTATRK